MSTTTFPDLKDVPETVSQLVPYAALIFTIGIIATLILRRYIFEDFLMLKFHRDVYLSLDQTTRRSFLTHYVAGTIKLIIFVLGIYAIGDFAWGSKSPRTPYAGSRILTTGDMLIIVCQLFCAMITLELYYKDRVGWITTLHHVATLIMGQTAIALTQSYEDHGVYTYLLAMVWGKQRSQPIPPPARSLTIPSTGAFDVVTEFWPHMSIVVYRLQSGRHLLLKRLFLTTFIIQSVSIITQTGVVIWLLVTYWDKWLFGLKISSPILHTLFSLAQMHGAGITYKLYKKQKRLLSEKMATAEIQNANSLASSDATLGARSNTTDKFGVEVV